MKTKIFSLAMLAIASYGLAQDGLWKKTSLTNKEKTTNELQLPEKNIYELDLNGIKAALSQSPLRFSKSASTVVISLPGNNGKMEQFRVYENSTMDAALQAKYPEIKSYIGVNTNNSSTVYFSLSPLGFKSMTIYPDKSALFIEPVSTDLKKYSAYKRADKQKHFTPFECGVMDHARTQVQKNNNSTQKNANDATLRTYRLAMSATGEYTSYFGGTKANALAAINATMTRVNGIFEQDFAVRMTLIANTDAVIYTNSNTDPYTNGSYNSQLASTLDNVIGSANYDIGHLVSALGNNGNAGCIGCVCSNSSSEHKGSGFTTSTVPTGDNFDVDFVAHEIGHQFGANHTFSFRREGTGVNVEPGSGSTIMGYAGITPQDIQAHSDPFFHAKSIEQVTNYVKSTSCQTNTPTGNTTPTANAGTDYTIPKSTPFMLTGTGSDANGDALTYIWEQIDDTNSSYTGTNSGASATKTVGPMFRSWVPTTSPVRYFPRMQSILSGATTTAGAEITVEALPSIARTMNFRFTVRDNRAGGAANNSDDMKVTVNGTAGPFNITSQGSAVTYTGGSSQNVTWNVAGTTANGVNCANVDILWSTDNGSTWTTILAATPNDGSQSITIPNANTTSGRLMVKGTNHIFFDVNNANITVTQGSNDTTPPSAPTNLTASGTTSTSTNLSWNASTDNVGVTGYDIYRGTTLIGNATSTSYTATGLTPATTYTFSVKAKDAAGNISSASNTVSVTTLTGSISYCNSQGNNTNDERIGKVAMGSINNASTGTAGYENFTNISTDAAQGSNQTITITPTWTGRTYPEAYAVFIDYNQDGDFTDAGETVWTQAATTATTVTGNFTIPASATLGNTRMRVSMKYNGVPTSCETFTYGQVEDYTVKITDSSNGGNLTYCESQGNNTNDERIAKVVIGSINNPSTGTAGYEDFTSLSTNANKGSSQTITITPFWTSTIYSEGYAVFIDYNQDGDFIDAGETVWTQAATKSTPVTGTFTIPTSALNGATRMRVSMKYNGVPTSCEKFSYGQVEDYTIVINNSTREEDSIENNTVAEIIIYPNPASSFLNVTNTTDGAEFSVYNLMGQNIKRGNINNHSIDISSLPSGNYLLEIKDENNVITKPFIKQ